MAAMDTEFIVFLMLLLIARRVFVAHFPPAQLVRACRPHIVGRVRRRGPAASAVQSNRPRTPLRVVVVVAQLLSKLRYWGSMGRDDVESLVPQTVPPATSSAKGATKTVNTVVSEPNSVRRLASEGSASGRQCFVCMCVRGGGCR